MLLNESPSLRHLPVRLLLSAVMLAGLLWCAQPAGAATYAVDSCQRPDNSSVGVEGWTSSFAGAYVYTGSSCASGGVLGTSFDAAHEHGFGENAAWSFRAPAGTSLARIEADRDARAGSDRAFGSPMTTISADSSVLEACSTPSGCDRLLGTIAFDLGSSGAVRFSTACGGGEGGRCPAGDSRISLRRIRLTLNDTSTPSLARAPSGTLTSATDTSRVRALSYSATDSGSGLYRHRLLIDGAVAVDQPVDPGFASCARHHLGGFASPTPCPLSSGGTIELDTASLADGTHQLRLEVYDATGTNKVTEGPWNITVGRASASSSASPAPGVPGQNGTDGAAGSSGSTSAAQADAASGNVAAAVSAAVAAVPQCTSSKLSLFGVASSIRRSYSRSRVRLSGRLAGLDGRPRAGHTLKIVQTVVRSGSVQRKTIRSVRTSVDGRFRTSAPPGPSRALQLIEEGCGAVGRVITERVRGAMQARTTTRRVRNKQTARIRGRVRGGYLGRGIPVELQVKVGRKWRDVKHVMTNSRGEYKVGYRFTRTFVRYTYSFRVVTRAGGSWPFMAATSRTVKVRVN